MIQREFWKRCFFISSIELFFFGRRRAKKMSPAYLQQMRIERQMIFGNDNWYTIILVTSFNFTVKIESTTRFIHHCKWIEQTIDSDSLRCYYMTMLWTRSISWTVWRIKTRINDFDSIAKQSIFFDKTMNAEYKRLNFLNFAMIYRLTEHIHSIFPSQKKACVEGRSSN